MVPDSRSLIPWPAATDIINRLKRVEEMQETIPCSGKGK